MSTLNPLAAVDLILNEWRSNQSRPILEQTYLLEVLHHIQRDLDFIPSQTIPAIADAFNLSRSEVYGVATFYDDFKVLSNAPKYETVIRLCESEACQSMGAHQLKQQLLASLDDDSITIEPVYCLGNCALAPAVLVNDQCLGRVTAEQLITELS